MKKGALVLFAVAAFLASGVNPASAQAPFEGSLTWAITIPQLGPDKHEMMINIKGEKTETEMDLGVYGVMKSWVDKAKNMIYTYNAATKTAIVVPGSSGKDEADPKDLNSSLKATGKKAVVAGHSAEEYLSTMEEGELHIWASSDFPAEIRESMAATMKSSSRNKKGAKIFSMLAAKGMVPVKVEMLKDGEQMMGMELEKVDVKKVDDSVFELPKDVVFKSPSELGKAAH